MFFYLPDSNIERQPTATVFVHRNQRHPNEGKNTHTQLQPIKCINQSGHRCYTEWIGVNLYATYITFNIYIAFIVAHHFVNFKQISTSSQWNWHDNSEFCWKFSNTDQIIKMYEFVVTQQKAKKKKRNIKSRECKRDTIMTMFVLTKLCATCVKLAHIRLVLRIIFGLLLLVYETRARHWQQRRQLSEIGNPDKIISIFFPFESVGASFEYKYKMNSKHWTGKII